MFELPRGSIIGILLLGGSVSGVLFYGWLVFSFATITLQVTAFAIVAALFAGLAWIGWSMAVVPPPPVGKSNLSSQDTQASSGAKELITLGKDGHQEKQ